MFQKAQKMTHNPAAFECDYQRLLRCMLCEALEIAHRRTLISNHDDGGEYWQSMQFRFEDALETLDAEFSSIDYPDVDARRMLRGTFEWARCLVKENERE